MVLDGFVDSKIEFRKLQCYLICSVCFHYW